MHVYFCGNKLTILKAFTFKEKKAHYCIQYMFTYYLNLQDTGLHYDRYLREVIDFLEKDQHFREKLHNTDMEDIKVRNSMALFVLCCTIQRSHRANLLAPADFSQGSWLKSLTLSATM